MAVVARQPSAVPRSISRRKPASVELRNIIVKEVAKHVARLALEDALGGAAGPILNAIEIASWVHDYAPYILAYADAPKELEELRQAVATPRDRIRDPPHRRGGASSTRWLSYIFDRRAGQSGAHSNLEALANYGMVREEK